MSLSVTGKLAVYTIFVFGEPDFFRYKTVHERKPSHEHLSINIRYVVYVVFLLTAISPKIKVTHHTPIYCLVYGSVWRKNLQHLLIDLAQP